MTTTTRALHTFTLSARDAQGRARCTRIRTGIDAQHVAETEWGHGARVRDGRVYWGDPTCSRHDCLIGWITAYGVSALSIARLA